jgi:hypothetical protein
MFLTPYHIRHAIRDGISIPTGAGGVQISAGTASVSRSDFTFSNSPTVTFGLNGAGVITASAAGGGGGLTNIKFSAGIASDLRSDITFSNSNGVSFGLAAGVITATVATNYQSPGAYLTTAQPPGAYLTTAMASGGGSNFVQANATFFGTNASGTIASNAISVSVAAPSGGGAGTGFTTATTAGTNIIGTLNAGGLSMGIPAYLTTAAAGTGVGTNTATATTAGTALTLGANTSGITIGYPAWLTTAAGGGITNVAMSAGTVSTLASAFTFSNANNVTFGLGTGASAGVITAQFSATGGAGAGTNTSVATIAGTDLTLAVNTSGVTIGYPAWLTTAGTGGAVQNTLSYFVNLDRLDVAAQTIQQGQSVFFFDPVLMPCAASFDRLRMGISYVNQTIQYATSTNQTSYSAQLFSTFFVGFYSMLTGVTGTNSNILSQYVSTSAGFTQAWSVNETGSRYTVLGSITYPTYSGTSSESQQAWNSNSNIVASQAGVVGQFLVGIGFMDMPFATSFSAGNYWIGIGVLTNKSTQGDSRLALAMFSANYLGNLQYSRVRLFLNGGGPLIPDQLGAGIYTNSVTGMPLSLNISSIVAATGNSAIKPYWQAFRLA